MPATRRRRRVAGYRRTRQPNTPGGPRPPGRGGQWVLALLPAFPILLLVLRLWVLSRQDLATMLLLVQQVNPLGLASALVLTLAWVPPVVVLAGRLLGLLQLASQPGRADLPASWLALRVARTPDWVIVIFVAWAAMTWQLQFLPALVAVTLAIVGLTTRIRYGYDDWLVTIMCVLLPATGAISLYVWFGPGILAAFESGDLATGILLAGSPVLAVLTGPIPRASSRVVTQWLATVMAFGAPFVVGAIFLGTPVLPEVALEIGGGSADRVEAGGVEVVRSEIVTVDDRMTTLLSRDGRVRFVRNELILSKVLCPDANQIPVSDIVVHGWGVEETVFEFLLPPAPRPPDDPRCEGRPLGG
jgi:hypothetical protein